MKLQTKPRSAVKKSETNKLRRDGFIPAVLYVRGNEGETLALETKQFAAFLRQVRPGHLPTTVVTLVDEKGKERRALIKDIQYNITTYDVIHLDFEELIADQNISVKVPIECVGAADCVGVKLGGVLRQVIRHFRVSCKPADMPAYFELDIKDLALFQSKRLSDIKLPNTLRPLVDTNEVAAVIVKR